MRAAWQNCRHWPRHGYPVHGYVRDLEAAIAEGATMVRVGTAIFGPRNR